MGHFIIKYHKPLQNAVNSHYYNSRWSFAGLKAGFEETNELNISMSPETKTSLKIKVWSTSKEHDDTLNIAVQSDKYKTLERTTSNPFGPDIIRHFFKVTKKQGLNEAIGYVLDALDNSGIYMFDTVLHVRFIDTDKMTINIAEQVTNWED